MVLLVAASLTLVWAIRVDLTPYLRGPAPYPEWRWLYLAKPALDRAGPALLFGLGILGLIALTGRRWKRRGWAAALLVVASVPAGVGFQLCLLDLELRGATVTLVERSADPSFTSHLSVAASREARDVASLLANFETLQLGWARSAPHSATHPPGAVLLYRAGIELCAQSPAIGRALFDRIVAAGVDPRGFRPPLSPPAAAAALLLPLVLTLLSAVTAAPIALAAWRLHGEAPAAARAGMLWLLLPGPALMLPVAAALAALLVGAGTERRALGWIAGGCAGVAGAIAVHLSYGAAAFLAVGSLAALGATFDRDDKRETSARTRSAVAAAFVLAGLLFFLPALWGTSPIGTARTALSIHRAGFTAPRSYPLWLLFNPIDFLLFLGPPVALAAIFRIDRSQATPAERRFRSAFAIGVIALLISGVVRGEVGRIAIPLMPAALLALLPRPRVQGAVLVGALLILLDGVLRLSWQLP